ncbi:MAG: glycosyltransferase family 2 protein [Gammaproteobacteria bacterium]|nr:glycosyltransferase family 2 protein [Gammaproteobacteria bacterium]
MTAITGTIITYNEEDHIEACIASLRQVCDDVVVVDSLSTDRTCELARSAGARVVLQKYLGEGRQRKVTEKEAGHDWILALDADERLDEEAVAAVRAASLDDAATACAFNRKSFVGQRWIRAPGWYPDYITRLYNRTRAGYEARYGHAGVVAPRVVRLPGHILHYTYDDLSDWVAKINQVTSLDARGMFEAGQPPSAWKPMLSALSALFRQLVLRGGLFHGIDGRTIAATSAFRCYLKYLKLNELHEGKGGQGPS